jgi:hypothetical protein
MSHNFVDFRKSPRDAHSVTINHHITLLGIRVSVRRGNFVPDELSPALLLLFLILPYLQLQNLKLVLLLKIGSPTQTCQNQVL